MIANEVLTRQQLAEDYQLVERALAYLENHYQEQPSLEQIAAQVGLSEFYFQRVFTRWVGISPKRFLQFLTKEHARQMLDHSASVLDATYRSGLSSPGRLHDLFVTMDAVTPGEYKQHGYGLTISYGFHPSPFGECLLALTGRGICGLSFVTGGDRQNPLDDLRRRWMQAEMHEEPDQTSPWVEKIFPLSQEATQEPMRLIFKRHEFPDQSLGSVAAHPGGKSGHLSGDRRLPGRPKCHPGSGACCRLEPDRVHYSLPSSDPQDGCFWRLPLGYSQEKSYPGMGDGQSMRVRIWLAMLAVYIFWGSTYLAIRYAVGSIPPFLMAASRHCIAGLILFTWMRVKGVPLPKLSQWRVTAIMGLFLLLGGNGLLVWAEQRVISSVAALMIGSVPLWIVLVDSLRPGGKRPGWQVIAGVLVGFIGIVILINPFGECWNWQRHRLSRHSCSAGRRSVLGGRVDLWPRTPRRIAARAAAGYQYGNAGWWGRFAAGRDFYRRVEPPGSEHDHNRLFDWLRISDPVWFVGRFRGLHLAARGGAHTARIYLCVCESIGSHPVGQPDCFRADHTPHSCFSDGHCRRGGAD